MEAIDPFQFHQRCDVGPQGHVIALERARTLILNADYRPLSYFPLSTIGWEEAVRDVFLGRFAVVDEYDLVVHSPSTAIRLPSVVALKEYVAIQKRPAFCRANVFLRDDFRCQYCGGRFPSHDLSFDHVIPRSRGGPVGFKNIVSACLPCNTRKANRTPEECGMKLIRAPEVPSGSSLYEAGRRAPTREVNEAWNEYLYWTVELDQN